VSESAVVAPFTADDIAEALDKPAGGCLWRLALAKGGEIIACTFAPDHDDDHSWKDRAIRDGGRVIRPDGAA
jgi:hypothetical protein